MKYQAYIGFFLSLPFWFASLLLAQTYSPPVTINSNQGISQNAIRAILEDHNGFLWFGTDDGLNKYDGYTFTIYRNNPRKRNTISCNTITYLYEDSRGILWIGTERGGLNKFNPTIEQFTVYMNDSSNTTSISNNHVTVILEDNNKELWIGTTNGLNHLESQKERFSYLDLLPKKNNEKQEYYVKTIIQDNKGILWIGTMDRGLYRYNLKNKDITNYQTNPFDETSISNNNISSILEDKHDQLWIGTFHGGLNLLNRDKGVFRRFLPENGNPGSLFSKYVRTLRLFDDNTIAVLTNRTVDLLDINSQRFNTIWINRQYTNPISMLIDSSKVIWVGTTGTGIGKLTPKRKNFRSVFHSDSINTGLSFSGVRAIYEDSDGDLWVGGHIGLNILKHNNRTTLNNYTGAKWEIVKPFAGENIFSVVEDPLERGVLWLGSEGGGLFRYNTHTTDIIHFFESAKNQQHYFIGSNGYKSYVTRENEVYVGSEAGLSKWNPQKQVFENITHDHSNPYSIGAGAVKAIFEDSKGKLWIGTDIGGVSVLDQTTGHFERFEADRTNPNALSDNKVNAIFQDSYGVMWIGTSAGLNKLLPNDKRFILYTTDDGLPNDFIYAIEDDKQGNLWLSTNKGISRFDPVNETFKNYNKNDGLQGDEFNTLAYFKSKAGEIFFGGVTGFTSFFPEEIQNNPVIPKVVITGLRIFNQSATIGTQIQALNQLHLSYTDYVFSLEFTALEFTDPMKNTYAYKMEGFDESWRYTNADQRVATYTNLDAGDYVFNVKASNNDGIWNESGSSLRITITPPFWKTLWFRLLGFSLLFVTVYGLYRLRITSLQQQRSAKQKLAHQLIESQESERKRIASEMHDAIGQDLLIIKNLSFMALEEPSNEHRINYLNEISETASQTIEDVRKISHNLRPYQIDKLGITKALESILINISKTSTIRFSYDLDSIDGFFMKDQEIHVYRILQECVNNIIKHSDAHEAVVTIRKTDRLITFTIKDDGKGLPEKSNETPPQQFTHGFGLSGISERVTILNGTISIRSQRQQGTTLIITLPEQQHGT